MLRYVKSIHGHSACIAFSLEAHVVASIQTFQRRLKMSEKSKIEWTDATWNPVRGCVKVSPGCAHCYAETFAERFRGVMGHPFEQGFDLRIVPHKLVDPATWGKSKVVFVNSMSDLFQNGVPNEYVETVCRVMQRVDWHSYQVLTKRSQRMRELLSTKLAWAAELQNVIWGVSVENRKHGFPRLEDLRNTPAAHCGRSFASSAHSRWQLS